MATPLTPVFRPNPFRQAGQSIANLIQQGQALRQRKKISNEEIAAQDRQTVAQLAASIARLPLEQQQRAIQFGVQAGSLPKEMGDLLMAHNAGALQAQKDAVAAAPNAGAGAPSTGSPVQFAPGAEPPPLPPTQDVAPGVSTFTSGPGPTEASQNRQRDAISSNQLAQAAESGGRLVTGAVNIAERTNVSVDEALTAMRGGAIPENVEFRDPALQRAQGSLESLVGPEGTVPTSIYNPATRQMEEKHLTPEQALTQRLFADPITATNAQVTELLARADAHGTDSAARAARINQLALQNSDVRSELSDIAENEGEIFDAMQGRYVLTYNIEGSRGQARVIDIPAAEMLEMMRGLEGADGADNLQARLRQRAGAEHGLAPQQLASIGIEDFNSFKRTPAKGGVDAFWTKTFEEFAESNGEIIQGRLASTAGELSPVIARMNKNQQLAIQTYIRNQAVGTQLFVDNPAIWQAVRPRIISTFGADAVRQLDAEIQGNRANVLGSNLPVGGVFLNAALKDAMRDATSNQINSTIKALERTLSLENITPETARILVEATLGLFTDEERAQAFEGVGRRPDIGTALPTDQRIPGINAPVEGAPGGAGRKFDVEIEQPESRPRPRR